MNCPLCGKRKARRACPALRSDICSFCCGTKRLTEIQCPEDCPYLSAAREHPPAAFVRQQQRDIALLLQYMRDFSEGQSQLFLMAGAFLAGYQPPELHALLDEDVAGAAAALAATYETAAQGVIYEHRPTSAVAGHLAAELKPLFEKARGNRGSIFERDAAVVLRRIGEAVGKIRGPAPEDRRPFLDLLSRMIRTREPSAKIESEPSRLIVP